MKTAIIIPARMSSTRFPGKPIVNLCGKPMIQWVYESALKAEKASSVIVATCDNEIYQAVKGFGGQVVMTSLAHTSGTDRIAEAADTIDADVVVNVQGDEPLIDSKVIDMAIEPFESEKDIKMVSLMTPIDSESAKNPNLVKVVVDKNGFAMYFSRSVIPYERNLLENRSLYGHIGLYAYEKDFLLQYSKLNPTPLEQIESLEQLRVLENGYKIRMIEIAHPPLGVDTPEDLHRVESILKCDKS